MLWVYLLSAIRGLLRYYIYSASSVLAIGLCAAVVALIALFIRHEASFDRFHRHHERIYRLIEALEIDGVGENSASVPFLMGPHLAEVHPQEVESYVRFFNFQSENHTVTAQGKTHNEPGFYFVDSTFFRVFSFRLSQGDTATALSQPMSVCISERTARKYFPGQNPIGQRITYGQSISLTITGVFEERGDGSHLQFDLLASMSSLRPFRAQLAAAGFFGWVWNPCWTYLLLKPGITPETLEYKIPADMAGKLVAEGAGFYLQPLTEIHLHSTLDYELSPNSEIEYVTVLGLSALLLLAIGMVNFVNLSTVRLSLRYRELGTRMGLGADMSMISRQFVVEFLLIALVSFVFSLLLIEIFMGPMAYFLDLQYKISGYEDRFFLSFCALGACLLCALVAVWVPFFYLGGRQPAQVLHGLRGQNHWLRRLMVLIQLVITVFLFNNTLVIFGYLVDLMQKDMGFEPKGVLTVTLTNTDAPLLFDELKAGLMSLPEVAYVSCSEEVIGYSYQTHGFAHGSPQGRVTFFPSIFVREDFVNTMGIPLVAGQGFSQLPLDERPNALIANMSFVRHAGWQNPEHALGQTYYMANRPCRIVGVVEDFRLESWSRPIKPFLLIYAYGYQGVRFSKYMYIRLRQNAPVAPAIERVKSVWQATVLGTPMNYFFLEDKIRKHYAQDERFARVQIVFTCVSMLVACAGLLGLTAYTTWQRSREIAIRKSLGATDRQVFLLLSREYILVMSLALFLALTASWLVMQSWVSAYLVKVGGQFWPYLVSGGVTVVVTFSVIFASILRASTQSPVRALKLRE